MLISEREYRQHTLEHYLTVSTQDLTDADIAYLEYAGVINGCGGSPARSNGWKWVITLSNWILAWLMGRLRCVFFTASCAKHDFGYWKGGDESRRKECDFKFFQAMIADIQNHEY